MQVSDKTKMAEHNMSEPFQPNIKMSLSEEMFSTFSLRNNVKTSNLDSDPSTSYEVFRNNTTAVEVIVKEVPKAKKKITAAEYHDVKVIRKLKDDIDKLKSDLNIANNALARSRKGFLAMVREMRKQLDAANQSEMETQTKNMTLQLDNEKLKSMLLSKTNLLSKLKKELGSMKRVMRYVIKSICTSQATPEISENVTCSSEPDYDEFENDLKKNVKVKFASNMFEEMTTFDSSKDTKYSFDKRLL